MPSLTDSKASLGAAEALICGLHTTEMVQVSSGARVVQSLSTMLKSDGPSSPTMVDLSCVWENPQLVFEQGGIAIR